MQEKPQSPEKGHHDGCLRNFSMFLQHFHLEEHDVCFKNNNSRCLKITEKVSFNIASEASYVYIFIGQKFIKKCQNCSISQVFENETFLKIFKQCALVWRRTPTTYLLGKSLVICIGSNLQFWLKRSNFTCQFLLIASLKKYS